MTTPQTDYRPFSEPSVFPRNSRTLINPPPPHISPVEVDRDGVDGPKLTHGAEDIKGVVNGQAAIGKKDIRSEDAFLRCGVGIGVEFAVRLQACVVRPDARMIGEASGGKGHEKIIIYRLRLKTSKLGASEARLHSREPARLKLKVNI